MSQRFAHKGRIRIGQLRYPRCVVDTVNVRCHARCGNVPVCVLQGLEVDEGDWHVPVMHLRRVRWDISLPLHNEAARQLTEVRKQFQLEPVVPVQWD